MRYLVSIILSAAGLLFPFSSFAQSADVESAISKVDVAGLSLTLEDGKVYRVPEEFNFNGLTKGVKVVVFYTEVDGKRVVDDLQVMQ